MKNITGERIKKQRLELRYTQQQLGDLLHISKQAVSSWEKGINLPDSSMLNRLSEIFNCSIDYLIGKEPIDKDNLGKLIEKSLISKGYYDPENTSEEDKIKLANKIVTIIKAMNE